MQPVLNVLFILCDGAPCGGIDPSMDPVPRGALTNPAACQSTPLHRSPVSGFLIGADLKGESNVTLMKDMPFSDPHMKGLWVYSNFIATQQLPESCFSIYCYTLTC